MSSHRTTRDSVVVGRVPFTVTSLDDAVDWVVQEARDPASTGVAIRLANAFSVVSASRSDEYAELLSTGGGVNLPDGAPVAWAMRRLGAPRAGRVRGPSFFEQTLSSGRQAGLRHYFFGTDVEVLERLVQQVHERFGDVTVAGTSAPGYSSDPRELAAQLPDWVSSSTVDIVWVGLGSPKQDFVAASIAAERGVIAAGVGAAFDFTAGTVPEAPKAFQRAGLEWLFRLVSEPRRLWRRYLIGNVAFLRVVLPQIGRQRERERISSQRTLQH